MEGFKISLMLFQAITPFIIVGIVYLIWHRQKGKEVIAEEAKEVLFRISKVTGLSSDITSTIFDCRHTGTQTIFDEQIASLKVIIDELRHSLLFMSEATADKELTELTAEYWYNCMWTVQEYSRLHKKVQTNHQAGDSEEIMEVHNKIIHNSKDIKNRLYKISTYQD